MHGRPPLLARQVSAVLLVAVMVLIVVLDVVVEGYDVSPPLLVPLLLTNGVVWAVPQARTSQLPVADHPSAFL